MKGSPILVTWATKARAIVALDTEVRNKFAR